MIDPHVHLRDWNQKEKETVSHGLYVAEKAGLDAVFDMPNTDPLLTSEKNIKKRILLAESVKSKIFYGLYAGVTSDTDQIEEIINAYYELFPKVVGLKLYAGSSTGNLSASSKDNQYKIFKTLSKLDFKGVISVHCEKESLLHYENYKPDNPYTHTLARPEVAETESIKDIIECAENAGFKGTVHICHISLSESVNIINSSSVNFELTCGITPHHLLLNKDMMKHENGFLLRMNPPLRAYEETEILLKMLFEGKIDWIETDHAPHKLIEKRSCSGIPGFPVYPVLIKWLREKGFSKDKIIKITHDNIQDTFNIKINNSNKTGDTNLFNEYEYNAYQFSKKLMESG